MVSCGVPRRWLLLIGTFMIVFLSLGTLKSNGLFIKDMKRDLQTTTAVLGLAIGLGHGLSNVLALFNIPLLKKFSTRQLMVSGSLIGSLSLISAAFSQSGIHLVCAMGISGAAFSIVILPATTRTTLHYFPDAFENATSFILADGSIGMMLLPPLSEWFHETYGWRGAISILGEMNLHCVVVGALMNSAEVQAEPEADIAVVKDNRGTDGYAEVTQGPEMISRQGTKDPIIIPGEGEDNQEVTGYLEPGYCPEVYGTVHPVSHSVNQKKREESKVEFNLGTELIPLIPVERVDTGESTLNRDDQENSKENCPFLVQCITRLKNSLDLELFMENPAFVLPLLSVSFIFGITYTSWIIFLIPNAVAKGYATSKSALLATTAGAANIAGRFAIGFISSRNIIRDEISFGCISLVSATTFFSNTFATSFWSLILLSVLNGFTCGTKVVMKVVLAKKNLPLNMVTTGICYVFFAFGLGEPVGGSVIGSIFDLTSSCVLAFNVVAIIEFLSALLIMFPLFIQK